MGTWGIGFDENDGAADWLLEFGDAPSWEKVDSALKLDGATHLWSPEAENALAAAEIVAAGRGKPSSQLEAFFVDWAQSSSSGASERQELAIRTLKKVRDSSELNDAWQETDEYADWQKSVDETLSRLG